MARPDIEAVIGANEAGFIAAMNRVRNSGKSAARGLSADFSEVGTSIGRLNGLLAAVGIGVTFDAVVDAVKSAGEIADVADKVGVGTVALQELRFAADQAGASASDLDAGLTVFAKNISLAAAGQVSNFSKILDANGIALRDTEGNLRPVSDLLRDYADLVRNVSNEQDQLRLTMDGFGKSAGSLVGALKAGGDGFDEAARKAHDFGVVLEDETVRAAQQMADDYDAIIAGMNTKFQWLVVNTISGAQAIGNALASALAKVNAQREGMASANDAGALIGAMAGKDKKTLVDDSVKRRNDVLRQAIEASRNGGPTNQALPSLRDDLLREQKPTIVPMEAPARATGGGGSRSGGAKAAREERDAAAELIAKLEEERALIGASDAERRIANELRRAGADATEKQKKQIADLVTQIEKEEAAQKKVEDAIKAKQRAADDFASRSFDALWSVLDGSAKASDALKKLALDFAKAAAQAALLGTGPLAGVFGGGGGGKGGLLTGIFGALFGARADGGPVTAGKLYRVGERGPEYFRPNTSGSIVPNGEGGASGGAPVITQNFTISGAISDKTVIAMVQRAAHEGARMAGQALQGNMNALQTHGAI